MPILREKQREKSGIVHGMRERERERDRRVEKRLGVGFESERDLADISTRHFLDQEARRQRTGIRIVLRARKSGDIKRDKGKVLFIFC